MAANPDLKTLFVSPAAARSLSADDARALVARFPWFAPARALCESATGVADARQALLAPWRVQGPFAMPEVDAGALMSLSADDVIDRFLREENLRIVADEGEAVEEVLTEARLDEEDEVVSEELAAIYLAQGLRDKAAAIYRKLSLLNPEKSIYFAEQIAKIENNN